LCPVINQPRGLLAYKLSPQVFVIQLHQILAYFQNPFTDSADVVIVQDPVMLETRRYTTL